MLGKAYCGRSQCCWPASACHDPACTASLWPNNSLWRNLDPWSGELSMRDNTLWDDDVMVTESDNCYAMSLAVPGVKPGDISLSVHDGSGEEPHIELSWKRSSSSSMHSNHIHWEGKTFRSCAKRLPIPANCDSKRISAELADGQLTITMAKTACCNTNARCERGRSVSINDRSTRSC
jgi:HSP20 family molecular chaperone IbpA